MICIHHHLPSHPIHLALHTLYYTPVYAEQQAQASARHHAIRYTRVHRAHHRSLSIGPHGLDDRRHDQRGNHGGKIDTCI